MRGALGLLLGVVLRQRDVRHRTDGAAPAPPSPPAAAPDPADGASPAPPRLHGQRGRVRRRGAPRVLLDLLQQEGHVPGPARLVGPGRAARAPEPAWPPSPEPDPAPAFPHGLTDGFHGVSIPRPRNHLCILI